MTKKILLVAAIASFIALHASAQLLSINDAKTKFEGSVDYRMGTPINENPEGKINTHEAFWHNFLFTPLDKVGVELHHMSNDGANNHANHYFRFGLNGQHVFMLPGYTRGIAVTANLYGEASQKAVHHFDGVISTLFMFSTKPNDSRGVGFIWLVNNPSKMFGLPIFTWNRKFNDHWRINWMTWIGDFTYSPIKPLDLTLSYGFGFERYWMDYKGETCMANTTVATPTFTLKYHALKNFDIAASAGMHMPFMGSLFNEKGTEYITRLDTQILPFISGKICYRF